MNTERQLKLISCHPDYLLSNCTLLHLMSHSTLCKGKACHYNLECKLFLKKNPNNKTKKPKGRHISANSVVAFVSLM